MNEHEINDAYSLYSSEPDLPVIQAAVNTLYNLKEAVNANSDGWPHWRKPSNASRKLQEMVQRYRIPSQIDSDLDASEYKRALSPIKAFRTRTGLDFEICQPVYV
jgi:hypothetical protein